MTFADRLARRPRPAPGVNFARIPRRKFEQHCAAIERQRDNAIGQRRAHADWVSSWLQQRADAHDLDGKHHGTHETRRLAHRMTADDLRELMHDLENGPRV